MKKIVIISAVVIAACAGFYKLVYDIMGGSPVIKNYSYSGSVQEFISHVQSFSYNNANITSEISDKFETMQKDSAFFIDIKQKINGQYFTYLIKCKSNSKSIASGTSIDLEMASDTINHFWGYDKGAEGIKPLIDTFEINFLTPLGVRFR